MNVSTSLVTNLFESYTQVLYTSMELRIYIHFTLWCGKHKPTRQTCCI